MKNTMYSLAVFCLMIFSLISCENSGGGGIASGNSDKAGATKISGNIKNAFGLNAIFQELHLNQPDIKTLDTVKFSSEGAFSISIPDGLKKGFYGLRIGQGYFILVSDGTEKNIQINGDIQTLSKYDYTVTGSEDTRTFATMMQSLVSGQSTPESMKEQIVGLKNPYLSMLISMQVFRNNPQFIDAYKAISNKANAEIKNSNDVTAFTNMVAMLSNPPATELPDRSNATGPQLNVKEGQLAPDIALPDPNGKVRSLASLRGKVVLIDFWASWCGPCRKANPHVVELYKKYKDQGFTVFSVSLDRENGKERWIQAIQADGLVWENHVSDLKFWNSEAARQYGINSIPQTLLVDRKGKIAAIIPQGVSPESYIKKAL